MPESKDYIGSPVQSTDLLAAHLHQLDIDGLFKTVRVLKETEWERTELICDDLGTYYVRKYLTNKDGFGTAYTSLMNMSCPCFPKIYACYPLSDSLVVIMEYLKGQTLRQYVEKRGALEFSEAFEILQQLSIGLIELHGMRPTPMIHRDVNPGNIIVTDDGARLIDFGIARRYDASAKRDTHIWGTQGYAPPEQFGFGQSDERTDVYALGMVLYFMLTSHEPEPDLQDKVATQAQVGPNQALYTIIRQAITLDKNKRYSDVRTFLDALSEIDSHNQPRNAYMPPKAADLVAVQTFGNAHISTMDSSRDTAPAYMTPPAEKRSTRTVENRISNGLWFRDRPISSTMRFAWYMWQGVCAFMFGFVFAICLILVVGIASNNPSDLIPALACYGGVSVCFVAPSCIVASNFCNIFGRWNLLVEHRWIKAISFVVGMAVLGCILIVVFYGMYSPEYFAAFETA